jgi:tetratricopeptide (TPR) repeat protein/predicted aspartyl protease
MAQKTGQVGPGFRLITRLGGLALSTLFLNLSPIVAAASTCQLGKMAEFPITMSSLQPLMSAKINDTDVQLLVDSGAFYSMLSGAAAAELNLPVHPAPYGFYVIGLGGGTVSASIATANVFTLAGTPFRNIAFLVGGSEPGTDIRGVLGQNVLHLADVEYDLGQGFVRLMRPHDCDKAVLAYWVAGTTTPYSVINIEPTTRIKPFTTGFASINGKTIRVMFDSGASVSMLSLKAAALVGIKPDSPGVTNGGTTTGIGRNTLATYIAPFSSFRIGGEEIQNTRLRVANIDMANADMLIGADFFLSHRIYVANAQHKLYFTYNGGPVFNLSGPNGARTDSSPSAEPSPQPASTITSTGDDTARHPSPGDTTKADAASGDAADYARRGAAFASRHQFDDALAALTKACDLAPGNADYFLQRGRVYRQLKNGGAAMADFDRVLTLRPDDVAALVSRAELSLQNGDNARAGADLDAANSWATKQADVHYQMAMDYQDAERLEAAIAQLDLWIASHEVDVRYPQALNSRCWLRALQGVDLALALKDCDAALKWAAKASPLFSHVSDSRGLVHLRMGEYDKSIADYDASLKADPRNAWAWYGRGIAKLRTQRSAEGQADIAQATALSPKVAAEFGRHGIDP